jgi:hypothetical protein
MLHNNLLLLSRMAITIITIIVDFKTSGFGMIGSSSVFFSNVMSFGLLCITAHYHFYSYYFYIIIIINIFVQHNL